MCWIELKVNNKNNMLKMTDEQCQKYQGRPTYFEGSYKLKYEAFLREIK